MQNTIEIRRVSIYHFNLSAYKAVKYLEYFPMFPIILDIIPLKNKKINIKLNIILLSSFSCNCSSLIGFRGK